MPHASTLGLNSSYRAGMRRALAATIALVLLLVPLTLPGSGSANAATLRMHTAGTPAPSFASIGTAEWTSDSPDMLVPPKAQADLGTFRVMTSWAVADNRHFRNEATTSGPPLLTQSTIAWANGGASWVWYNDLNGVAMRMPLPPSTSTGTVSPLSSGGALTPTGTTVASYLTQYNHSESGVHARMLGRQTYLGRIADVVEVRPVIRTGGTTCHTDASGKQHCKKVTHAYGTQRILLDDQHLVILQAQISGVPARFGGDSTYRVTSITFDQQPTLSQLAFTPPVPVTDPPSGDSSNGNSGSATVGGRERWLAPDGFISAGRPVGPNGAVYTSTGTEQSGGPGGIGIVSASVIFGRTPQKHTTNNFVLLQEQIRKNGPPPLFAGGTTAQAGTCHAVTGSFPDGIHWLGFSRGSVYVLVSSDHLSESALVQYVATKVCT